MNVNATKTQRFFAYFIDFLILSLVSSFILRFVFLLCHYDTSIKNNYLNEIYEELANWLRYSSVDEEYNLNYLLSSCWQYLKYYLFEFGVQAAIMLVLCGLYFVVLPKFWEKQTLGRTALNVRVIRKDGEALTWKNLILREILGTFLMYHVLGFTGVMIATIILTCFSGRSLVDYIGGTLLVPSENVGKISKVNDDVEKRKLDDSYFNDSFSQESNSFNNDSINNDRDSSSSDDYKLF